MVKDDKDLLAPGAVIEGRWTIRDKLGNGGFGQVYRAMDQTRGKEVAVKVEPRGKKEVLSVEAKILEAVRGKTHFPGYYGIGGNSAINFLVMDVLGKNLSDLRRDSPGARACFSRRCAFLLALQALEGIEDMQKSGYIHRDIKPSNYVMGHAGSPTRHIVYIIDYGLARALYSKDGSLKEARPPGGFRGTVKYASPAAHDGTDLGRKDDLYSHFYMTLEMARGTLPWRRLKEKAEVGVSKKTTPMEKLCDELPRLMEYGEMLGKLEYESEPDYAAVKGLLTELLTEAGGDRQTPLDWDENWITQVMEQETAGASRALTRQKSLPGLTVTWTGGATGASTRNPSHDKAEAPSKNKKNKKKKKKAPTPSAKG